jgi:putative methyltransferase (TIGR04325 family)
LKSVHFHSEEQTCLGRNYDLVLASGSLQYSQNWREILGKLARVASSYLYVPRLPIVYKHQSFVVAQQAYGTVHAGWFLNKSEFLEISRSLGLRLLREFAIDLPFQPTGAPEMCHQEGFLISENKSHILSRTP